MGGLELVLVGVVGLVLAILSGMAGGGGGFIMTPLLIFLGLAPAEAISTGKLAGLAMAVGSLAGMKAKGKFNWKITAVVVLLSVVAGLISTKVIVGIDDDAYGKILGVLLIIVAPLMHFKKLGHTPKEVSNTRKVFGYIGIFIFLLIQGIFSSGLGVFVNLAMISGLGLSAIQTNITRRTTQVVMNTVIVFGLFGSDLIHWNVAAVLIVVNLLGSYIGGRIAVKRGDGFVASMLAVLAFISGVALLVES